jgi:hypothetical protein
VSRKLWLRSVGNLYALKTSRKGKYLESGNRWECSAGLDPINTEDRGSLCLGGFFARSVYILAALFMDPRTTIVTRTRVVRAALNTRTRAPSLSLYVCIKLKDVGVFSADSVLKSRGPISAHRVWQLDVTASVVDSVGGVRVGVFLESRHGGACAQPRALSTAHTLVS